MRLKLTHSEFFALHNLLQRIVNVEVEPASLQGQLFLSIMNDLWGRFYRAAIDPAKKKYSIEMKKHEAIGFWFFFEKFDFTPEQVFECNLVHTIRNTIHQKLCI